MHKGQQIIVNAVQTALDIQAEKERRAKAYPAILKTIQSLKGLRQLQQSLADEYFDNKISLLAYKDQTHAITDEMARLLDECDEL